MILHRMNLVSCHERSQVGQKSVLKTGFVTSIWLGRTNGFVTITRVFSTGRQSQICGAKHTANLRSPLSPQNPTSLCGASFTCTCPPPIKFLPDACGAILVNIITFVWIKPQLLNSVNLYCSNVSIHFYSTLKIIHSVVATKTNIIQTQTIIGGIQLVNIMSYTVAH